MKNLKNFLSKNIWLILIVFAIPAVWSLFVAGYGGLSDDMHVAWLHQMDEAVQAGKFPPRYVPHLSYGFGYPLFNFVFPLPFYVGEIFHLTGFSLVASLKAVFVISIFASMGAMYLLLSKFTNGFFAVVGAVVYTYTPYRATDIFVRGAVGESLAFVFLPLIILSIVELKKNKKWIGIGALSIAGLILSHNIMATMFIPTTLVLSSILIFVSKDKKRLTQSHILTILLGFLMSIYFWFPAIIDSQLMKYDTVFNPKDHFPTIKQLITPYFGYGTSVPGPFDHMSFFIGIPNLILLLFGFWYITLGIKKGYDLKKVVLIWGLLITFASVFMMNYRSGFLWDRIPLIPYFQFPWRFLSVIAFASSLFAVLLDKNKFGKYLGVGLVIISLLFGVRYFRPFMFTGWDDDYFINRYIPVPIASQEYKRTSEEYLRLPRDLAMRPDENYPRFWTDAGVITKVNLLNSFDTQIEVEMSKNSEVYYRKYKFPGWVAYVDGKEAEIIKGKPFSQIAINVPEGKHTVKVIYKETTRNLILDTISLFSLFITTIIIVKFNKR